MKKDGNREEWFWRMVDRQSAEQCWEWNGAKNEKGYGIFGLSSGRTGRAHRYSYQLAHGPIPPGLFVLHRCDNPPCCNPSHLFVGAAKEHHLDSPLKGRAINPPVQCGDGRHKAKLSCALADLIRERYGREKISQRKLAREFGVAQSTIGRLLLGLMWKDRK